LRAEPRDVVRTYAFKVQHHVTATALPQRGAQRIAHRSVTRAVLEHMAGVGDGVKFQMPATHGGHRGIREDCHPGAHLARDRAARGLHGHQHSRFGLEPIHPLRLQNHIQIPFKWSISRFRRENQGQYALTYLRTTTMTRATPTQLLYRASLWTSIASLLAACNSSPPTPPSAPAPLQAKVQPSAQALPPATAISTRVSYASTPRDYRRDGATHLYTRNSTRIFAGKMPPLLYAIGVLQVDINASGSVTALHWMRAPKHAPEVMAEIERAVRSAAPFPAPIKMGRVTYTDTWLWDKSGRFQLDTLTEGQL